MMLSGKFAHASVLMQKLSRLNIHDIYSFLSCRIFLCEFKQNLTCYFSKYFHFNKSIHSHFTRSSNDLHRIFARTTICARSIKIAGLKLWNSLHDVLKQCHSKFVFKRTLKAHLLTLRYNLLLVRSFSLQIFYMYILKYFI